ncbi:MAG: hypothetical protein JWN62_4375, partial [Acidimicrobiales bacterium]|nr:hypothetical protein [Acidimicrobiales bacterium]
MRTRSTSAAGRAVLGFDEIERTLVAVVGGK